VEQVRTLVAG